MNYVVTVLGLAVALSTPVWAQERPGEGGGVDLSKYRCAEYLEVVDARDGHAPTFQVWGTATTQQRSPRTWQEYATYQLHGKSWISLCSSSKRSALTPRKSSLSRPSNK